MNAAYYTKKVCIVLTSFKSFEQTSNRDAFVFQVQIRPWNLSDSDFVMDGSQPLDPRKTIFVGGVPRPLRAGNPYECGRMYSK